MLKTFMVAAVLTGLVTPALAEYWVVKDDPSTRNCSIVEKKPEADKKVIGVPFQTRQEAQHLIETLLQCGGGPD
jgi:hypothetical protein